MDEKTFTLLVDNIRKKMTPNPVKVRSDFEISCFTYEGIDAIRGTLMQAKEECSTEQIPIRFRLIAPPLYECSTQTLDKKEGLEAVTKAVQSVETLIKNAKGTYKLVNAPQVIGAKDEEDIEKMIKGIGQQPVLSSGEEDNEEGMNVDIGVEEEKKEEESEGSEEEEESK